MCKNLMDCDGRLTLIYENYSIHIYIYIYIYIYLMEMILNYWCVLYENAEV